jgi:hypothetical protein
LQNCAAQPIDEGNGPLHGIAPESVLIAGWQMIRLDAINAGRLFLPPAADAVSAINESCTLYD